jgi:molybdate transport system regulatory protein
LFDGQLLDESLGSRHLDSQGMRPRLKVWIETEDGRVALSEWRVALLQAVAEHGSLVSAARAMGVPHRTAWQRIQEMEASLGVRLLETVSGGLGGGGSTLSPAAQEFIRKYQTLRAGLDELVNKRFDAGFEKLSK